MTGFYFPEDLQGFKIFFVGIKGTGMAALAELLYHRGADVSGSDVSDVFYTDKILASLGIPVIENFDADVFPPETELVIYSAAYRKDRHPQLLEASRRNIPLAGYTEVLGLLSGDVFSCGISGVHGKTTTTALAGTLIKKVKLPVSVLVGSGVSNFDGSSVLVQGKKYFVAETCEYKRHFLQFNPDIIVITSIEPDHLDYYTDMEDILEAFVSYGLKLPQNGRLIFCADDPGAVRAAERIASKRPDIRYIEYGEKASGMFRLLSSENREGRMRFALEGFFEDFAIRIPGHHSVLDAVAALAVVVSILEEEKSLISSEDMAAIKDAFEEFSGSKRRSEIIGEWNDILVMDDYGHHPTEIKTTLEGLREFYPNRRLIVDFMSHTYSRTELLLEDFADAFDAADLLVLHKIYASAREKKGSVSGLTLFERIQEKRANVYYFDEILDAFPFLKERLKPGDLFITVGAGDNWILGEKIASFLQKGKEK